MQSAIDRVMQAYGMMNSLTAAEECDARERLALHLAAIDADENGLAIMGLRFLRGPRIHRARKSKPASGPAGSETP